MYIDDRYEVEMFFFESLDCFSAFFPILFGHFV